MVPVTIYTVMMALRGEATDLRSSFVYGTKRMKAALGALLFVAVPTALQCLVLVAAVAYTWYRSGEKGGVVMLIFGIIYLLIDRIKIFYLATAAAVVENLSPRASLRRSALLTDGGGVSTLALLGLQAVLLGAPIVLMLRLAKAVKSDGAGLAKAVDLGIFLYGSGVVGPMVVIFSACAFFYLREQKEGVEP